jgi:tetratricopeptide (TPR) repeat protein
MGDYKADSSHSGADPRLNWPYATKYLLETLDPELIEAHGEQILSRALNIGRTVGFIGAGVAMSYGRISWQTLVETELARVEDKLAEAELRSDWHSVEANDARRLAHTLRTLKLPRSDIRTDRYPMLFQVSEQLDDALNKLFKAENAQTLHSHAMMLTVDDEGQAYQVLIDALRYDQLATGVGSEAKRATEHAARKFIDGVLLGHAVFESPKHEKRSDYVSEDSTRQRKAVDHTAYRVFFDTRHLKSLLGIVEKKYAGREGKALPKFLDHLLCAAKSASTERPARYQEGGELGQRRHFLLPTDRYLVGALLNLAPRTHDIWKLPARDWWIEISTDIRESPAPIAITTRHGLVPQWRDPLLYMQERLQINRYITTNYDHEIERMFRDQSFRSAGSTDSSEPLLRPIFDEIIFDNTRSGELSAFAVRDRSRMGSVVHLHGRAEKNASQKDNKIVVTENDYQRRYLREGFNRKLVDDSIRLAFGSNPILFVGSNMGEDDLLRPLRQFMSGPARVGDRVAVAIIPAMADRARRAEEKIALLGRYGVYAIHFGNCRFDVPGGGAKKSDELEWVPWFWSMRKCVREILLFLSSEEKLAASKWGVSHSAAVRSWSELVNIYEDGPELTPVAEREIKNSPPTPETDDEILTRLKAARRVARASLQDGDHSNPNSFELFAPSEIERQPTGKGAVEIGVEIGILNSVFAWLQDVLPTVAPPEPDELWTFSDRLEARALLVALDGAGDSVLSIFTCARLQRAKTDWEAWKRNWFELPAPAKVLVGRSATEVLATQRGDTPALVTADAIVTHRHAVRMPIQPDSNPRLGRFYSGAPSQSAFALCDALGSKAAQAFREARGRRFLVLSSRRGLGKGHFFSSLSDCKGAPPLMGDPGTAPRVLEFLSALNQKGDPNPSKWIGLAFINLSFSQEVMSAFDRVIQTFYSCLHALNPTIADSLGFERLQDDRLERLRLVLSAWAEYGIKNHSDPKRLLVAFNGFSILFDHGGQPKNGQIKRLCDLLFSEQYYSAPIDFVLLCQTDRLPTALVRENASSQVLPLVQDGRDPKGRAREERTLKTVGLGPRAPRQLSKRVLEFAWQGQGENLFMESWNVMQVRGFQQKDVHSEKNRSPAVAIHVLREARAVVIAAAYFPRIAVLIARDILRSHLLRFHSEDQRVIDHLRRETYPCVFESSAQTSREAMRLAFNELQARKSSILPKHFAPISMTLLAVVLEFIEVKGRDAAPSLIKQLLTEVVTQPPREAGQREDVQCLKAAEVVLRRVLKDRDMLEIALERFTGIVEKLNEYMRALYHVVHGGRFLLTLIFTAAYESTADLSRDAGSENFKADPQPGEGHLPVSAVDEAARRMMRVLDHLKLTLLGVPASALSNVVIEEVTSTMRRRSERDDPLPLPLNWADEFDPKKPVEFDQTPAALKPLLHKLMMEVLWHLAIIGQPIERIVLEACPRIQRACRAITDQKWDGKQISLETCIREALALATNRCLAFSIGSSEVTDGDDRTRYSVHRLVQRYVFRSLGASDGEFTDVDLFTLSLYASQPDDLPRMTLDAHRDISDVIASLSGYPTGPEASTFAQRDFGMKQLLLRASLGITRTIYSVAVLSRFDRRSDGRDGGPGREGYFEEHRRRVRWLIAAGVELTRVDEKYAPYYAEEVVWLYNECGLLSLVEGRLADAHALFGRALEAAKSIEPDHTGPLHVRILLNKSLSDIERGHGVEARAVLEKIAAMIDEHPVIPLLARGYLGLIDHLAGEVEQAIVDYEFAIDGLAKLGRSRAASIFSRHYGDLLGGLRQTKTDQGRQRIEDAIHFAQEGGHEDIRYLALLSLAKLNIRDLSVEGGANVHKDLDAIEEYARVVGMPRMLCEVVLVRARLLLQQGETERAGTVANEGLKIASVNDLRMRKVSGLLILAAINLRRQQAAASRPLLDLGMRMAKASNSHFSLTQAQALEHQLGADLEKRNADI